MSLHAMKMAPCPFCGSEDTRTFNSPDEHGRDSFGIQCGGSDCAITGPERGTAAEAVEAWNRRAAISQAEAGDKPVATMLRTGDSMFPNVLMQWHPEATMSMPEGEYKLYTVPPTHTAAVQAALTYASKELADHIQHAGSPLEAGTWRAASEFVAEIKPEDVLEGK